ncbi:hypothetical protein [Roseateles sp. PN1]|uniref:hypothetical protein n=1 Tax=Roseateles sp. PN1 TaxID=3137372 RepID=UPI003138B783
MSVNWGDIPAYLALCLSIASLGITFGFNGRQRKFFENQELLNKQMMRQIDDQAKEKRQADLGARIVKQGNGNRLKVFNSGKAPARHVRMEILDGSEMLIATEVSEKFPVDQIDPGSGIELIAITMLSGPRKVKVRFLWEDDHSAQQEKIATAHA